MCSSLTFGSLRKDSHQSQVDWMAFLPFLNTPPMLYPGKHLKIWIWPYCTWRSNSLWYLQTLTCSGPSSLPCLGSFQPPRLLSLWAGSLKYLLVLQWAGSFLPQGLCMCSFPCLQISPPFDPSVHPPFQISTKLIFIYSHLSSNIAPSLIHCHPSPITPLRLFS
jgi:hypothetical protein